MTLDEHVDNVCNWKHNAGLRNAVLEEMQAAVEEEREVIAGRAELNRNFGLAEWIRARSTADNHSAAPAEK